MTLTAGPAFGQATDAPQKMPDSATIKAHKKLFNHRDLLMAGAFTATTLALTPLDKSLAHELQDSSVQTNKFLKNASKGVELIASPGAYYIGGTMYIVGRLTKQGRFADLGWHGTEAVLLGELTSYGIKGLVGRAPPFVAIEDTDDFRLGGGFGRPQMRSLPAGH
jgi:hypothetical protein